MIWQFTYIQKVAVILLFLGKNTRDNKSIFISQNNTTNPNLKEQFYIPHRRFTMGKNGQKQIKIQAVLTSTLLHQQ